MNTFTTHDDEAELEAHASLPPNLLAIRDRARRDFPFFAREFLKIKPKKELIIEGAPSGPLIPLEMNIAQRIVWQSTLARWQQGMTAKPVVLKSRQVGISTLYCAVIFWLMWRQMHTKAAVVAFRKDTTLKELNETMATFYANLPENFRPRLRQHRKGGRVAKGEVYFDDRKSDCMFVVQSAHALRGVARTAVLNTEVSFYEDAEEYFGGFLPSLSQGVGSLMVRESSPADGYFRDIYKRAQGDTTDEDAIFIAWWYMRDLFTKALIRKGRYLYDGKTERRVQFTASEKREQEKLSRMAAIVGMPPINEEQMYWRQATIEEQFDGEEEFFNQEYPRDDVSAFERATKSVFRVALPIIRQDSEATSELYDVRMCNLRSSTHTDAGAEQRIEVIDEPRAGYIDQDVRPGLAIYVPPIAGNVYVIGADVADEADDADESESKHAFSVACVYCCNSREQVAEWRGHVDPLDWGDELAKLGYFYNTAMVCVERNNMGIATEKRIVSQLNYPMIFRWPDFGHGGNKLTNKMMWETNVRTKMLMIANLRQWLRDRLFIVRSPGLADELAHYVLKGSSFESQDRFSDRIIAAALAVQCVEQTEFRYRGIVLAADQVPERKASGAASRFLKDGKRIRMTAPDELPEELEKPIAPQQVWDTYDLAEMLG